MLRLINTLTKKKEDFIPLNKNKVTVYQCGPTVYSRQHIGNLFSAVKGDLIRKCLVYLGYNVIFTRNITDVGHLVSDEDSGEDKMEKGAKREGLSPNEIAKKYTEIYHKDLEKLNCLLPDNETKATDYVIKMAEMVQVLIDKGFAYATSKAIYFDVTKFPSYNALNGQNLEMNRIGSGHGDEEDIEKKHAYDFSIWFFKEGAHQNALQTWEYKFNNIEQSNFQGFPGWHIECSVMSKATLGNTIDIHIGGIEHVQVHNTNEIAQSESANGVRFVDYWLHHEMLEIDGEKMSKSKGNIYTLDDIIKKDYDPLVLRYFFLLGHYRSKQNFTFEALDASSIAYSRLVNMLHSKYGGNKGNVNSEYKEKFISELSDDFNIPKGISVLWELVKDKNLSNDDIVATALDFDKVLGLSLAQEIVKDIEGDLNLEPEILQLMQKRQDARDKKDWNEADRIRRELKEKFNYNVIDK